MNLIISDIQQRLLNIQFEMPVLQGKVKLFKTVCYHTENRCGLWSRIPMNEVLKKNYMNLENTKPTKIQTDYYNQIKPFISKRQSLFNKKGRIIKPNHFDSTQNPYLFTYKYTHNNKGKLIKMTYHSGKEETLLKTFKFSYDHYGNLISESLTFASGLLAKQVIYNYDFHDDLVEIITILPKSGEEKNYYRYRGNGNSYEIVEFCNKDIPVFFHVLKTDEFRNVIEETKYGEKFVFS